MLAGDYLEIRDFHRERKVTNFQYFSNLIEFSESLGSVLQENIKIMLLRRASTQNQPSQINSDLSPAGPPKNDAISRYAKIAPQNARIAPL